MVRMSTRHCVQGILGEPEGVAGRRLDHLLLLSPIAVIAMGQLAARIIGHTAGTWAWAYLFAGYWVTLAGLILWGGGRKAILR